jgi:hypothetical protein
MAFAFLFVIAIAIADPWMWAIYGVLLVIAVVGGLENARRNAPHG